jgi:hypothetical protein
LFLDIKGVPKATITIAGGIVLRIIGHYTTKFDGNKEIQNILYIPGFKKNLLYVRRFANIGHLSLFVTCKC